LTNCVFREAGDKPDFLVVRWPLQRSFVHRLVENSNCLLVICLEAKTAKLSKLNLGKFWLAFGFV
jgi:hypothetical protein